MKVTIKMSFYTIVHVISTTSKMMYCVYQHFGMESQQWKLHFKHFSVPVWLSGRALRQQRKRLWVRFPGNTHTNVKLYNLNAIVSRFG